jgi:NAD+ kinase
VLAERGIATEKIMLFDGNLKSLRSQRKIQKNAAWNFAVTLGGDGTALFAARLCAPLGIPILPINLGSFGFICGIKKDQWKSEILSFLDGTVEIFDRSMVEVLIVRDNKTIDSSSALNDIVITAKQVPHIISLDIRCNDIPFGQFKADAIIVSTATGSTAYSAAAGGPIIDPSLDALILTPVCPFSLSSRPLVLSPASELNITLPEAAHEEIQVHADGQHLCAIERHDTIIIKKSQYTTRLHAGRSAQFYAALRSKMNWSGGPVA